MKRKIDKNDVLKIDRKPDRTDLLHKVEDSVNGTNSNGNVIEQNRRSTDS